MVTLAREQVRLVEYLFKRLSQLGIKAVHGVPGDFNIVALDYIRDAGLEWVGDANELNAGYAADGYARVKGMGAVITTFGVGELSAINAIGGSYSEFVPVVHIVGTPSTSSQRDGRVLHHSLGDGNFKVFAGIYKAVTVAQADLLDPVTAPREIDRVLRTCWIKSRPVYIQVPTDMVHKMVDGAALREPIELSTPVDVDVESDVVSRILADLYASKRPCILVDGFGLRPQVIKDINRLVRRSKLPSFVSPMCKGVIDETQSSFAGIYAGIGSYDSIRGFVDNSDLVLSIGAVRSDFNTTGFTHRISQKSSIEIEADSVRLGYAYYAKLCMSGIIRRLVLELDTAKLEFVPYQRKAEVRTVPKELMTTFPPDSITHEYLWPSLSSWLKPQDIVLTESGTANLGIWDTSFPSNVTCISQTLWGSIGFALPAAQGAATAAREMNGQRVILFVGDGSFQVTAQALGTMIANKLNIVIFMINNSGYTMERWVHGMEAQYNDIADWRYTDVPLAFGGSEKTAKTYIVNTKTELEALLADKLFQAGKGIHFVDMRMPKEDAPLTLRMLCTSAAKSNVGHATS